MNNPRKPFRKGVMALLPVLLFAAVAAMVLLKTCTRENINPGSGFSGGDTIDVAIEFAPQSMYVEGDSLTGFNLEAFRVLQRTNQVTFKFHPVVTTSELLEGLGSGRFDVVAADMPMILGTGRNYVFTDPLRLDNQVLVQGRDSAGNVQVHSQLDLASRSVWVPAGSTVVGRLRNLSSEIGDTIIVMESEEYGPEQLFILAATGEIPLAVVSRKVAEEMKRDYPQADISTDISFTQFHSWLVRRGDSILVDSLNSMIHRFRESDEYSELIRRFKL